MGTFSVKMIRERLRGLDLGAEPPPIKICRVPHGSFNFKILVIFSVIGSLHCMQTNYDKQAKINLKMMVILLV